MNDPIGKIMSMVMPQAVVDNAAWTSTAIDTEGFGLARVVFFVGTTDIALAALSVTECDTSDGTYADITGCVVGTSTALDGSTSALPTATDDGKFWIFNIVLQGRKRYLKIAGTAGDGTAGTYACCFVDLLRPEIAPSTTAEMGAADVLNAPAYA